MADTTPSTGFLGSKAKLTWDTGTTYHGITNYSWSGSVQQQVIRFSSATGTQIARIAGTSTEADDTFDIDMVIAPGDATTLGALKRGDTTTVFEFHPEGDSAGNIEFSATSAVILGSTFSGSIDSGGILSLNIGIDGTLTITDAS